MRIIDNSDALTGFIEKLQHNNIAKVLADPSIVTLSGRPASFHVGGEHAAAGEAGLEAGS